METSKLKALLNTTSGLLILGAIVMLIIGVTQDKGDKTLTSVSYMACLLIIAVVLMRQSKLMKGKLLIVRKRLKGSISMEKSILMRLIDKQVLVHTMDEYVDGFVKEVTDTTLIVVKYNKDGAVKHTYYVNNSMIMTIEEK